MVVIRSQYRRLSFPIDVRRIAVAETPAEAARVGSLGAAIQNVFSFLNGVTLNQLQYSGGSLAVDAAFQLLEREGIAQSLSAPSLVMRGILFPSSNVLFDVQTRDPGAGPKGGVARADAATTSNRYDDVYSPWQVVDAAAISIAEIGPVLMQAGRRCENGKPVPIDRDDWKRYVQRVVDAGRAACRASQMRSQDAVSEATNGISDACANCHRVYRDVASAMRCTPP